MYRTPPISTKDALVFLEPNIVTQVYRGRVGCCCGCNGTHYEGASLTPRRVTNIVRDLKTAEEDEISFHLNAEGVGHICRTRNGRYTIAYLRGA